MSVYQGIYIGMTKQAAGLPLFGARSAMRSMPEKIQHLAKEPLPLGADTRSLGMDILRNPGLPGTKTPFSGGGAAYYKDVLQGHGPAEPGMLANLSPEMLAAGGGISALGIGGALGIKKLLKNRAARKALEQEAARSQSSQGLLGALRSKLGM